MGMFEFKAGEISLTRNEDIWSQTIRDTVLVSAYPLAAWMASSWWRLFYEPLPPTGIKPSIDWRMAHELSASNQGFIWPKIILASDTEVMQVWSMTSHMADCQSVRYINSLDRPFAVNLLEFEQIAKAFIESVICRLEATGITNTALSNLWQEVQEELDDVYSRQYRRYEAVLGFDPDECPENVIHDAINLSEQIGDTTFLELAPALSKATSEGKSLKSTLDDLLHDTGIDGQVEVSIDGSDSQRLLRAPWQRAVKVASLLRSEIDIGEKPITDQKLYDLIGLNSSNHESSFPKTRRNFSIAIPLEEGRLKFHPRKRHQLSRRFEMARFLGDYLLYGKCGSSWLTNTDLRTSRQKYQRAFAAEFLCPVNSLKAYLENDYSESAIDDAAEYFQVSSQTVESILANNGLITPVYASSYIETRIPY